MPEEVNRIVTDALSDLLWTPSPDGDENLLGEGVDAARIERVGNIMIDSFELQRPRIESLAMAKSFGLEPGTYAVVTLHRPSNVDEKPKLQKIVSVLIEVAQKTPIVFAVHPRTRGRLEEFGLLSVLEEQDSISLSPPLSYNEFMSLVCDAKMTITDSGGIQEETTYLGIPCLTLRDNTERPITITQGTNRLVRPENLAQMVEAALAGEAQGSQRPDLWDGKTAARVAQSLKRHADR